MPDTKITALAAITTVAPANDLFAIVDVSDNSMAASGTTKNITTNQILGAGGTATLASATITGDLTVDTSTLKVDSSNDRVGIGTATPAAKLIVRDGSNRNLLVSSDASQLGSAGVAIGSFTDNAAGYAPLSIIAGTSIAFGLNGTTAMTLNSTGLGIGASPQGKLHVSNGATTDSGLFTGLIIGASGTPSARTASIIKDTSTPYNLIIRTQDFTGGTAGSFIVRNGSTDQFQVDSSGNVGIGVTPSAWNTSFKAIELLGGNINTSSTANIRVVQNAVYTSSQFVYKTAGLAATSYSQSAGAHTFFNAPVGANANDPIIFSPAMTLDASGNLLLGVASSSNRLDIQKSTDCAILVKSTGANTNIAMDYVSNYGNHTIRKSGTAVWDYGVINDATATPAFKISNASSVGVQLVSGATAWTTLSDETMKDIIEPISNAVSKVGSLRSVIGKFKTDDASKRRSFLIAQDVQSVLPEAVDVIGENNELGLRYTEVIPLLVAAIQELTAEVNALKNA